MTKLKEEVVQGFNQFVKEQAKLGRTLVTTVVFNKKRKFLWNRLPVVETVMVPNDYQPGGMTALLDTIGFIL